MAIDYNSVRRSGRTLSGYPDQAQAQPGAIDPRNAFMHRIGATGVNSDGRPVGSTGGMIPMGASDTAEYDSMQAQPQAARAPAVNPAEDLYKSLGIVPHTATAGNAAQDAAIANLDPRAQAAGRLSAMQEEQRMATIAQRLKDTGGLPTVGQAPELFAARMKEAQRLIGGGDAAGTGGNPPPRNAHMGGGSNPTGADVLAAGGRNIQGYGGTQISGTTVPGSGEYTTTGQPLSGTHNRFMLRQNPATLPSSMAPATPAAAPAPAGIPTNENGISPAAQTLFDTGQAPAQFAAINGPGVPTTPQDATAASPTGQEQASEAAGAGPAAPVAPAPNGFDQAKARYDEAVGAAGNGKARESKALQSAYADAEAPDTPAKQHLANYIAGGGTNSSVIAGFSKQIEKEKKDADVFKKETDANDSTRSHANVVLKNIDYALKNAGNFTSTGLTGALMSKVPGSGAYDLRKAVDTVKSNIGLERLQELRRNSKTGASGLGQLSAKELDALQESLGNLDQAQSKEQFVTHLKDVQKNYQQVLASLGGKKVTGVEPTANPADAILAKYGL